MHTLFRYRSCVSTVSFYETNHSVYTESSIAYYHAVSFSVIGYHNLSPYSSLKGSAWEPGVSYSGNSLSWVVLQNAYSSMYQWD